MIRKTIDVENSFIEVLLPDDYADKEKMVTLWLIAPETNDAGTWFNKTNLVKYEEESGAAVVCVPGGESEDFYSDKMRKAVFNEFESLGAENVEHRILGLNESGYKSLVLAFKYPERFGACVAVCPKDHESGKALVDLIKEANAEGKIRPRSVISDTPNGQGESIGNKINELDMDCHVHATRESEGWELMDFEIKNCMAHLPGKGGAR